MRYLTLRDRVPALPAIAVTVAVLGGLLSWAGPTTDAQAKGAVKLRFCGTDGCVKRKAPRFTAAMLYGGRTHAGPGCRARVHEATGFMPRAEDRRFLIVASRGLIGEQLERGNVTWRQVRGTRKADLKRAVRSTGRGFAAGADLGIRAFSLTRRADVPKWRLRNGLITCTRPG